MCSRRVFAFSAALWLAGCAAPAPPPVQRRSAPSSVTTTASAATTAAPARTLSERIRREGWMTRFWEQLTPAQRRRVLTRLRRGEPPMATTPDEAAPIWDALGLPERDALIFGSGLARQAD